jgi:hypothetical protein
MWKRYDLQINYIIMGRIDLYKIIFWHFGWLQESRSGGEFSLMTAIPINHFDGWIRLGIMNPEEPEGEAEKRLTNRGNVVIMAGHIISDHRLRRRKYLTWLRRLTRSGISDS